MLTRVLAFGCLLAVLSSCQPAYVEPEPAPDPIKPDVPPIHHLQLKLVVTSTFTYPAKDEATARTLIPEQVTRRMNVNGQPQGNTFILANGVQENFTLAFTLNSLGDSRFTGSLRFSGWGQGVITTLYSGEYAYTNVPDVIQALTDKAYLFIKLGWHDKRKDEKK